MKISVICVGKLKEKYTIDLVNEYVKRLDKYCNLNVIEVKEEVINDESKLNVEKVLDKEADYIIKNLDSRAHKVCLAIEGQQLSSEEFADFIEKKFISYSHIQFIIGSSYGISNKVKALCDYKLSISKCTFTHQMIRGIVLEQVFRAYKIINNEKYHK